MELGGLETILLAVIVLQLGYFLQRNIKLFRKYYIPAPFIGGIIFSILTSLNIINIIPANNLIPIFVSGFFVSIGLRVDRRVFKKHIGNQMFFLLLTIVIAFGQNIVGLLATKIFGSAPYNPVILGSAAFLGDHTLMNTYQGLEGLGDETIAIFKGISVLSILVGTICGAIMFKLFRNKMDTKDTIKIPAPTFNPMEFLKYITIFLGLTFIGLLPVKLGFGKYINPAGGGVLAGLIFNNLFCNSKERKLENPKINLLGNFSLSMLLVLNFMLLNFNTIKALSFKDYLIVLIQAALLMLFAYKIVFKLYKENLLALYVASGIVGFSIGYPPSTMSNIQAFTEQEGAIPPVLFIVPVVGAWLITIFNPLIISIFM